MKFDSENLLGEVLAVMTAGLNTKISEIEAEKTAAGAGVTPTLATIGADAFYLQTWTDKILNRNPAIFYGIEDVQSVENGFGLAKTYKIFIDVVLVDNGNTNDFAKRVLRYTRALEELFQTADFKQFGASQLKVESVRPIAFKLELDSSDEIKIGGITLTITLF